jgi:hypothetical protein
MNRSNELIRQKPSRLPSLVMLGSMLVVAASAPASPGENVRQNRRDLKAEPADFEGPVAVELHEAFKSGAALVELELEAPPDTRCGELVVSVDRSGEKIGLVFPMVSVGLLQFRSCCSCDAINPECSGARLRNSRTGSVVVKSAETQ